MSVSDPDSVQYGTLVTVKQVIADSRRKTGLTLCFANLGQHWSQEQVHKAFEPSEVSLAAVVAWLSEHGIEDYTHSNNRQW